RGRLGARICPAGIRRRWRPHCGPCCCRWPPTRWSCPDTAVPPRSAANAGATPFSPWTARTPRSRNERTVAYRSHAGAGAGTHPPPGDDAKARRKRTVSGLIAVALYAAAFGGVAGLIGGKDVGLIVAAVVGL